MAMQGQSCSTAKVSGMTCEACASVVTANLKKLDGVKDVQVDVASGTVKIYTTDKKTVSQSSVQSVVERSGYTFNSLQPTCSQ
jgi:copper chaperone CopZ